MVKDKDAGALTYHIGFKGKLKENNSSLEKQ